MQIMKDKNYFYVLCLTLVSLSLSGCGGGRGSENGSNVPAFTEPPVTVAPTNYTYQSPLSIADGWQINDAATVGIDTTQIETVINKILDNEIGFRRIDGVAIAKDGELILDHRIRQSLDFADGWASNQDIDLHVVNSVTKSIMSLAMGVALEQGLIANTQALVHDYLTVNSPIANWNQSKASITLQDFLTMRHGYQWNEWDVNYLNSVNQNAQMNNAEQPLQFLLDLPLATEPGTTFAYSTGVSYALGLMIANVSGDSLFEFMNTNLFQPMNISKTDFWSLNGELHAGSALYLTQRDMTKFGQLVLDGGLWNGQQIVSQHWIEESTSEHVLLDENFNVTYGYQWWAADYPVSSDNSVSEDNVQTLRGISARGFGGQLIYAFPEIEVVIVFTGHRYEDGQENETNIRMIMTDFLLPILL